MKEYGIDMYLQFIAGNSPDSFYPGIDKLWFEILLDEFQDEHFLNTIDCNGFELPLEFMEYDANKRESMREQIMNKAVENIAEMLESNDVEQYVFERTEVDLMTVN